MPVRRAQLALFFAATASLFAGAIIYESVFPKYLLDTFGISAAARGWLEFPRELPGLLVVVMTGALCAVPVTRLGVIGVVVFAAGMLGLVAFGGGWWPMVVLMVLASAGMHLLQPVNASVAIALSTPENRGRRMGQMGFMTTLGTIVGAGGVWLLWNEEHPQYRVAFLATALILMVCAGFYAWLHIGHLHRRRARFVWNRKFRLYYWMEFLFGARKQIFLTFGPWVLIEVYGEEAGAIAGLHMVAAVIGLGFKPLAGWAIDRFGERRVLMFDGIALAGVCLGYGYSLHLLGSPERALPVAAGCFVADSLLFALGTGRAVYMSRLASTPEEVTATLSMGVSINHIASMLIPGIAGSLWVWLGYENVFLAGAVLALVMTAVCSLVPPRGAIVETPGGGAEPQATAP